MLKTIFTAKTIVEKEETDIYGSWIALLGIEDRFAGYFVSLDDDTKGNSYSVYEIYDEKRGTLFIDMSYAFEYLNGSPHSMLIRTVHIYTIEDGEIIDPAFDPQSETFTKHALNARYGKFATKHHKLVKAENILIFVCGFNENEVMSMRGLEIYKKVRESGYRWSSIQSVWIKK